MTSVVRPFIASLLIGMIAFGHATAWLHVANCDHGDHRHAVGGATERSDAECSNCCHHHLPSTDANPETAASKSTDSDERAASFDSQPFDSSHPHDSDSCLICHSLASPTGVTLQLNASLESSLLAEPALFTDGCVPATVFLTIPQPRGPPTRTA